MRIFPIITATLVCVALYFVILDRETLMSFAGRFGGDTTGETSETAPAGETPAPAAEPGEEDARIHVVVRRSEAQVTENAVVLRGRTEALRQVVVSAETSGRIVSEPLRAGARVSEGQLLCEIDAGTRLSALAEAEARLLEAQARLPEARAQLPLARARQLEAEAALTAARIDGNAATRLSESGFASETRAANAVAGVSSAEAAVSSAAAGVESAQAAIQSAESGIRAAEAAVTRAEDELTRLTIHAPFAGLLETDTAELGSLMQPGTPCATIIQLDPIKLVGFVPEAHVDRVRLGARAGARLASGRDVMGEVSFVSRSADPQTRTFRVEITVPNADQSIRDGQTADILIQTEGMAAHLLPASAMTLSDEGTLGVRTVVDGIVQFVPVRMIRDTANGVWLTGLPDMAEVITVGQEFVTDGVAVRVTYESEQTQ
ncbi:efflux RND transporter periplasmic adaptor subunit [Roseicyclus marinus]|uniref:efflux RND transporter periplasmic adaptor subunit n=1 Tax=Roseicyclus marinus TaxID=2161673 RepID=UPI00240FC6E2|nr:efflux RND transporter periplasmic adaptor subunit [Roseicyclus marinus]MDG3042746.1 efflux RND transporter periplasmic adaptor subunit [Roseicyclus marinus]